MMNAIWIAVATVSLLGLAFGAILGYASHRFVVEDDPVVERIGEVLPQSQCSQRGYPGCHPYAEAINYNGEKINRYAPGDEAVMLKIVELLNAEPQPLDDEAQELTPARVVAAIDESDYIGYTKCVQAYPVNVIVSATHATHAVMSDLYTGCNLCVDPCPTHCISLQPIVEAPDSWKWDLSTILVRIIPVEYHA